MYIIYKHSFGMRKQKRNRERDINHDLIAHFSGNFTLKSKGINIKYSPGVRKYYSLPQRLSVHTVKLTDVKSEIKVVCRGAARHDSRAQLLTAARVV